MEVVTMAAGNWKGSTKATAPEDCIRKSLFAQMDRFAPPESCDVVVIGAGMGGLVAAAPLSNAGLYAVVCDPQPGPGG
jgi:ribulose 1,5-bisphosphate synthetase/thiazole synthase